MPAPDAVVETLATNRGLLSEIAQLQAHALLSELTTETSSVNWTYVLGRLARNSTAARLELETLAATRHGLERFSGFARTLGLAWESMAKLTEGTRRDAALMNAAVMFELAGYQANAALLARRVTRPSAEHQSVSYLVALFLQRRLVMLREVIRDVLNEPPATEMSRTDLVDA